MPSRKEYLKSSRKEYLKSYFQDSGTEKNIFKISQEFKCVHCVYGGSIFGWSVVRAFLVIKNDCQSR